MPTSASADGWRFKNGRFPEGSVTVLNRADTHMHITGQDGHLPITTKIPGEQWMQPTTLKELEWIHDCVVSNVLYDASGDDGRSIKITMRCPIDLGYLSLPLPFDPGRGNELTIKTNWSPRIGFAFAWSVNDAEKLVLWSSDV
jgi:hypothetical protein